MNAWLLKTEPTDYCFSDLLRDRRTVWDGVGNNWALQFMRAMKKGDQALIYHTGRDKHIAGIAEVVRGPYRDPQSENHKRAVVDVKAVKAFARPVPLADIKADKTFADFHLVTVSRLSVMPVPPPEWKKLCAMGGV